jgi:hypothetical protein
MMMPMFAPFFISRITDSPEGGDNDRQSERRQQRVHWIKPGIKKTRLSLQGFGGINIHPYQEGAAQDCPSFPGDSSSFSASAVIFNRCIR